MNSRDNTKNKIIIAVTISVFALILYLVFGIFMVPMRIDGSSMQPTLKNEQIVYVQKVFAKYELGAVVVFERPEENYNCIKRIMGMPGDKIRITGGKLYRNGEVADDQFNMSDTYMDVLRTNEYKIVVDGEYQLADDEYFLLGDNRADSLDSRSYGGVKKEKIEGRALFVKD